MSILHNVTNIVVLYKIDYDNDMFEDESNQVIFILFYQMYYSYITLQICYN